MHPSDRPKILAVVDDLFFASKIGETAKRAGVNVEFATTEQAVFEKTTPKRSLIIVDLNSARIQPLDLVARLKNDADLKQIPVLGFVSHVQVELIQRAHQAGCDLVMARSAFSDNLTEILKKHSEA